MLQPLHRNLIDKTRDRALTGAVRALDQLQMYDFGIFGAYFATNFMFTARESIIRKGGTIFATYVCADFSSL